MIKKVHLLCNAHIDQIWQWEWEEGASSALSTFQSAANLLDDFNYKFNHNEVVLYKYTEKYAPSLFEDIKLKVEQGKWNVMGGWYLQPDCLMPCGEAIVRQIQTGKQYFLDKFNTYTKTAVNFDPFGHSRGLVQIIKKCGQENYVFMRPLNWFVDPKKYQLELPKEEFLWEGYDGSIIKATRCSEYRSPMGHAVDKIKKDIDNIKDYDVILSTWGVGNHGGGPSRKDLQDIDRFILENKAIEIVHSIMDDFFDDINPTVKWDKSIISCMVGCYTSMVNLKQKYRALENEILFTEKICSIASLKGSIDYPSETIKEAVEDMLNVEFHDVICGTTIKAGEENALNFIGHAMHLLNEARAQAFFGLIKGEEPAKEGEYFFYVFNPKTYEVEQLVEAEACFLVPSDFDENNYLIIDIYNEQGDLLTSQTIKEESNIAIQWRKRVIFKADLKPFGLTKFIAKYHTMPKANIIKEFNKDIVFDNGVKIVKISSQTGLIESLSINNKVVSLGNLFELFVYEDYEDPWGMNYNYVGTSPTPMKLMKKPHGVFDTLKSLEIVEDGDIYLGVECFFEYQNASARILYKIYKDGPDIDCHIDLWPGEINKAYKLHLPLKGKDFSGEEMFGFEKLYENGDECIAHNYLTLKQDDSSYLELITPSTYGSSYKDNTMMVTLLRSATYCAHPTYSGPIVPENTYLKKIDSGMRSFDFRLTLAKENELKKNADLFIEKPYCLNVFPTKDKKNDNGFEIATKNPSINVVTIKKADQCNGYIIRMQNNSSIQQSDELRFGECLLSLSFNKYEVKTILYDGNNLLEINEMLI